MTDMNKAQRDLGEKITKAMKTPFDKLTPEEGIFLDILTAQPSKLRELLFSLKEEEDWEKLFREKFQVGKDDN